MKTMIRRQSIRKPLKIRSIKSCTEKLLGKLGRGYAKLSELLRIIKQQVCERFKRLLKLVGKKACSCKRFLPLLVAMRPRTHRPQATRRFLKHKQKICNYTSLLSPPTYVLY